MLAAESVLSRNNTLRALTLNAYRNFVLNSCAVQFTCYTCPGGRQPSTTLLTHGERQMLPRRIKHPGLWWTAYLYFCFFFLLFFPFSFFFCLWRSKSMLASSQTCHKRTCFQNGRNLSPVSLCGMRMKLMTCMKKTKKNLKSLKSLIIFCSIFCIFRSFSLPDHLHNVPFCFVLCLFCISHSKLCHKNYV